MDQFKIGKEFQKAINKISFKTFNKGFTHSILEEVKDGDVVVFDHSFQANNFKNFLKEKQPGVLADVIVLHTTDIGMAKAKELKSKYNRVFFDNGWINLYYKTKLSKAIADFADFSYDKTKEEDPITYFSVDITEMKDGLEVYSIEEIDNHINNGKKLIERTIKYLIDEDSERTSIYCFAENDEYGLKFFVNKFIKKEDLEAFLFYYVNNAEQEFSLRDYFLAHALNGILAADGSLRRNEDKMVRHAYNMADKMIEQRNK